MSKNYIQEDIADSTRAGLKNPMFLISRYCLILSEVAPIFYLAFLLHRIISHVWLTE